MRILYCCSVMPKLPVRAIIACSLLCLCGLGACGRQPEKPAPAAVNGVIDLSAWNFSRDGSVALDGDWELYWQQLLEPQDFDTAPAPRPSALFALPDTWTGHVIDDGEPLPGLGYATFRLRARLPAEFPILALNILEMTTAYRLWVNGEPVASNGTVGTTRDTSIPQFRPHIPVIHPTRPELDIVLQISNFHHRSGGVWWSITLGAAEQVQRSHTRRIAYALFLVGSLLIMALYHLGLFLLRPQDRSTLYFSGAVLVIAIRSLIAGEYYFSVLFPEFPWIVLLKAEYLTLYLFVPLFAMFVQSLYPHEFSRRMLRVFQAIGLSLALFTIATPSPLFTRSFPVFEKLSIVLFGYPIYALLRAIARQRESARVFLAGFLVVGGTAINDMLYNQRLIHTGFLMPLGLFVFIFIQSYILAVRFSRAFTLSEELAGELQHANQYLEQRVEDRTQELTRSNTQLAQAKERALEAQRQAEAAQRAAEAAQRAAESANQAKSRFLAGMSHELRTPLNAILGFTQLLAANPKTPDAGEYLDTIQRSGHHLLTLINQVLDLSKIEADRMETHITDVDVLRLLKDIRSLFALKTRGKQIEFTLACDDDVPPVVLTDEVKLRQVLINLVGNAMKFTQAGQIAVRVWMPRHIADGRGPGAARLIFAVEDTGPGIAPEDLDQLFVAFSQTSAGQASQEGTGLGLALSQRLVQLLGGDIRVRSEVGRGTTFTFAIQAEISTARPARNGAARPGHVALAPGQPRYRLLIVDDVADNRRVLKQALESVATPEADFDIRDAENGEAALACWRAWRPHLIWLDIRMPGMDGYEVLRRIRAAEAQRAASENGPAAAMIAISANVFASDRHMLLAKGFDDFLQKPFEMADVFQLLRQHLGVQFLEAPAERTHAEESPSYERALSPDRFANVPADTMQRFGEAVDMIDPDALPTIIAEIGGHDAALAATLAELVQRYRFDILQQTVEDWNAQ